MAKISDIEIPSLLLDEQASDPATPTTGFGRLYMKAGALYFIDEAGTVTGPLGAAGGGGGGEFTEVGAVSLTAGDLTTSSTTFTDVTGASVTITTAAVRCLIIVNVCGKNSGASQTCLDIAVDGTRQGEAFGLSFGGNADNMNLSFTFPTGVLSAGSHTIKLQWRVDGGTGTLYASTAVTPLKFTVLETSMAS